MTETYVPVPGGRLFVVDDGPEDAPAILLLHAGIVDLRAWDDLAPRLVAGGFRVVRYDARGYGRSETEDVEYSNRADAISGDGKWLFVVNGSDGTVSQIDVATRAVVRTIPVRAGPRTLATFGSAEGPGMQAGPIH